MLVFWKEKLVVLAVPKTGTTALEQCLQPHASMAILDPPELKHVTAGRYRREIAPWITRNGKDPHETVAVIREPVDWLGSWYRYRRRPQLHGQPASTAEVDFDGFVSAWMAPEPPEFARVGSQARFLTGGRGRVLVDHLFAYEAFDRLLAFLSDRLEAELRPERVNVSPPEGLSLSAEVEARLRTHAALDFELWGRARDRAAS